MLVHLLNPLLHLSVLLLAGIVVAFGARTRAAAKLGRVLSAERSGRRPRRLALAGVAAAAALVVAAGEGEVLALAAWVLLPAAALIALYPAPDLVCGDEGVALGWEALRFEELDEWRLTGDHLRFRAGGEWRAVPVAPETKEAVRARLVAVAAERESAFRH